MTWIEVELEREGQTIRASARGARGERVEPFDLAPVSLGRLTGLASGVRRALSAGQALPEHVLATAQGLHAALFRDRLRELVARLGEAARGQGKRLLLRLMIRDGELQRFPWEVMCRADTAREFVGCLPDLMIARGVSSREPHEHREVRHAVRLLAVAPLGEADKLLGLRSALDEAIREGAIEWLEPIAGDQARGPRLFERLRRAEAPHVIHWLGHGGLDEQRNPCLFLGDDAGEKILAETLAQELRAGLGDELRLIVLEACEGARPGAFASAAELLAQGGAEAVVAHLWPIQAAVARDFSAAFYRALVGAREVMGDVAASLQATRRTFIERGAEVFSPVLYLRGADPQILDFSRRRLIAPAAAGAARSAPASDPALGKLLGGPFSLVLGGSAAIPGYAELVDHLLAELGRSREAGPDGVELSALAERLYLRHGRGRLSRLFQRTVGTTVELETPRFIRSLARAVRPGAHTTLLWLPFLEQAIADHNPQRTIHVVAPAAPDSGEARLILTRRAGGTQWEESRDPPAEVDLSRDFMILRLYGGYSPEIGHVLTAPQLTEDDHIRGLIELHGLFPPDWECQFVGWLRAHPMLCAGISVLRWPHRMLIRWLLDHRPPSRVSVAVAVDDEELEIWHAGAGGLFGQGNVRAVSLSLPELAEIAEEAPR